MGGRTTIQETLQRTSLGTLSVGDPVNLGTAGAAEPIDSAATSSRATSTARADRGLSSLADRCGPVRSRHAGPDLLRYVVEKGSIAVDGVKSDRGQSRRCTVRGRADPTHPEVTTLGQEVTRASPVNLGSRRTGQARRAFARGTPMSADASAPWWQRSARGEHGHRGRRRRARKRGRSDHGRRKGHARSHRLHDPPHRGTDLRAAARRTLRRALIPLRCRQHRIMRHRLHRLGRLRAGITTGISAQIGRRRFARGVDPRSGRRTSRVQVTPSRCVRESGGVLARAVTD